ncbi:MAG: glycosyltransferase [Terriglobales bacterium]
MRIIDRLNVGGPTRHVVWISTGLNPEKFQTLVLTGVPPDNEEEATDIVEKAGLQPLRIPQLSRELGLRDLYVIGRIFREMCRFGPDVVHTHKSKAGATGRIAAWLYRWLTPGALLLRPRRCAVLHTFHGHIFHSYYGRWKTGLFVNIERVLGHLCTDRIVTISDQQRREICEDFHIARPRQFAVIPLGLDFSALAPAPGRFRQESRIAATEFLISIVGRLTEVKNHALFLDSCALAVKRCPNVCFRFAIAGDGHLRAHLERQARALDLGDRVIFCGIRKDIENIYADSDAVALTSVNEGTPLTLLEAMSLGKPVVTTEVGGVVDILGDRQTEQQAVTRWSHGLSVPSGDAEAFAQAMCTMAALAKVERSRMGEAANQFVRRRHSKDRLIADLENLYLSMLDGSSS